MNSCRARTTSRDPTYRLFLVFLSFLIQNYWIVSRWQYASKPKKGGRVIIHEILRFQTFLLWLDRALEDIYGLKTLWINPFTMKISGGDMT